MDSVFPKKSAIATGLLSLSLFVGLLLSLWRGVEALAKIHTKDIPIIEMTAIGINFEDQLSRQMQIAILMGDQENLEGVILSRQALIDHLQDFSDLLTKNGRQNLVQNLDRKELADSENFLISLLENKKYSEAKSFINSEKYVEQLSNFKTKLQDVAESLAATRDTELIEQSRFLIIAFILSLVTFITTLVLWVVVFKAYRSNVLSRVHAERELEEERARVANSSKLATLGEMAGGIAHEINNPLAIIQGHAHQMSTLHERGKLTPEIMTDKIKRIIDTSQRIAKIIKGLRAISRNAEADPMENVSIATVIADAIEISIGNFKRFGIKLQVELPPGDMIISCRSAQIGQVLLNLLGNALDEVKEKPNSWVKVSYFEDSGSLSLTVTDSGTGIPTELAEKIFQPFFTTKPVGSGTGLGLSVAAGIAKDHGGELWIDSSNQNTTFVLTLPKTAQKKSVA